MTGALSQPVSVCLSVCLYVCVCWGNMWNAPLAVNLAITRYEQMIFVLLLCVCVSDW